MEVAASRYKRHMKYISKCFAHNTVEDIIAALRAEDATWTDGVVDTLRAASPMALKVGLEACAGMRSCGKGVLWMG